VGNDLLVTNRGKLGNKGKQELRPYPHEHEYFQNRFSCGLAKGCVLHKRSIRSLKPNLFENFHQGEDCCRVAAETGDF